MLHKSAVVFFILICFPFASFSAELEKMIGQMVMVGFKSTDAEGIGELESQIKEGRVGGVILYGYNVESPAQVRRLNDSLKALAGKGNPVLFTAVDQEGGKVQRLTRGKGFESFPSHAKIAEDYSPARAYNVFSVLAKTVKDAGFNVNFAPSVDLNINPDSPVIGKIGRSFSADPSRAVLYAEEFITAHSEINVATSLKHFPGHGSAKTDSHLGFTDITGTWSRVELEPFKALISKGVVSSVMTAHVFNGRIDTDYPATMSSKHLALLRDDLGFDGVIFSDDLQMGAVRDNYDLETALVKAVQAGVDVLVYSNFFFYDPLFPEKASAILTEAVKKGEIDIKNIEASYKRILRLKKTLN